jgi:hypothetical protein
MSKNGMVCRHQWNGTQTYFSVGLLQQLIDSTQVSAVFTRLIEDDRKEKERQKQDGQQAEWLVLSATTV